jgi:hypothetical protein
MLGLLLCLAATAVYATDRISGVPLSDADHDGLNDDLEQALLQRFLPHFLISAEECDGQPAEFLSGSPQPTATAQNGTIYGQAFPLRVSRRVSGSRGVLVELHFYHLWQRDCGRWGHKLDVEHVSALLTATTMNQSTQEWKALYWYAAAHQHAVCEASQASRSAALNATEHGPSVFISAGKHASYFDEDLCSKGCGGDRCTELLPLAVSQVINIGELRTPLNGAFWIESPAWPMAAKMGSDFSEAVLAALENASSPGFIAMHGRTHGMQRTIRTGDVTANSFDSAEKDTGSALAAAETGTNNALNTSALQVGKSLHKAAAHAGRWLGITKR